MNSAPGLDLKFESLNQKQMDFAKYPSGLFYFPPSGSPGSSISNISDANRKIASRGLVLNYLKYLVGHQEIERKNVILLRLEWSVDWIEHQEKIRDSSLTYNLLKKVASTYNTYKTIITRIYINVACVST